MNNPIYIYALCEPDEPTIVRYIGQTRLPRSRELDHRISGGNRRKYQWVQGLRRKGQYPVMRLLSFTDEEHADWDEREAVRLYTTLGHDLLNGPRTYAAKGLVALPPSESFGDDRGYLHWTLPVRMPEEWKALLKIAAADLATPTRPRPSIADACRECIYQVLIQRGKIEDRRK